jgi:signal transduction histidine kinase
VTTTPFSPAVSLGARARLPSRAAGGLIAGGALAIGAYYLLPRHPQDVLYAAIGLVAVVAAAARAYRRADARAAWICFALGLLVTDAGDSYSGYYDLHFGHSPAVPSAADVLYLAAYPFLAAGICLLLWELSGRAVRVALFDTAIITAAVVLVQWTFFVSQFVHDHTGVGERVVDMAYPSLDVLLLVGVLQLLTGPTRKSTSYRLIVVALLLWVVGDEIYGIWAASYTQGDWMDAFWLASYVAWAAAALDASSATFGSPDRRAQPRLSAMRITVLGAAVLTPAVVLVIERLRHDPANAFVVGGIGAAVTALALVRFVGLMRAYEGSRREERAARREAERARELLTLQNEELKKVDRLKDEFVSGISHELRTPLTSISGYVELLRELHGSPEAAEYLAIVDRNATRLLALVDDLLFAARVQAGQLDLEVAPVDLRVVLADAVSSARPRADRAGVKLQSETAAVPVVRGDSRRLVQVLDNLVSNAIKFTPSGGRVVVALSAAGERVRVDVSDTGIGMNEADQRRLFERFFRTQTVLERQIPGTGLGLYISKAIVESHGGTISVVTGVDRGSTFTVELPAG